MAVLKEEEEEKERIPKSPRSQSEGIKPQKQSSKLKDPQTQAQSSFPFWFYISVVISLLTLALVSLSSVFDSQDPKSWFLSLPPAPRQHYSSGRVIKVQIKPNQSPIEVFVAEDVSSGSENLVFVHGLGLSSFAFRDTIRSLSSKGVHVVALDLPGNGFSDKTMVVIDEDKVTGPFGKFKDVYAVIQEKGFFWAFDQMVETGQIPYEEIMKLQASNRKSVKPIELGSEEMGRVLGQVIDTMNLAPVHLVLHDSALVMASNWVHENFKSIRSVTLIDTGSKPALPIWVLDIPVIREIVLGFPFAFRILATLCLNGGSISDVDAQRILLNGRNGRSAVAGSLKKLNHSFDVAEWGNSDGIKSMPVQVIWAKDWSKDWSYEGERVAKALPQAKFITHSGGRWPQEGVASELAENIAQFVSSLPETIRQVKKEPIPERIQKLLDEAKASNDHHHGHAHGAHDDHHYHHHAHGAGYMEAYGLGHGWAG